MYHHRIRLLCNLLNNSDPFNITKMYSHIHPHSAAVSTSRQVLSNPPTSLSLIDCLDKSEIPRVQFHPPVYQIANASTGS